MAAMCVLTVFTDRHNSSAISEADMVVDIEPTITVLSGDLDQRGLHAVLDRVRALGLELVEINQAPPRPG